MENQIIEILKKASDCYYNTEDYYDMSEEELNCIVQNLHIPCQCVVTDAVYDAIYSRAKTLFPTNPFFLSVGSEVRGDKVKLPIPLGSMVEVKPGEVANWLVPSHYCISEKLDGISCLLAYDNGELKIAYSRGDGYEGQDITRHIIKLLNCPKKLNKPFSGYIRGEIIIPKEDISNCINALKLETNKEYKNGRNLCAGQLNAKDCANAFAKYAHFVAYYIDNWKDQTHEMFQELETLGFISAKWSISNDILMTDDFLMTYLQKVKTTGVYECDGIILTMDYIDDEHQGFETSSLNPKASRKFKISGLDETFVSTIENITWQISKDFLLKPVINIQPTNHNGVTISNISGNNFKFILDNDLRIGTVIKGKRSGDVIPQYVETIEKSTREEDPYNLDQFGIEIGRDGVELVFLGTEDTNPELCIEAYTQRTLYFCTKLGVEFGGYGNIQKLMEETRDYRFPYQHLCTLPKGVFESAIGVNGVKFYNSLHEKLIRATPCQLCDACGVFGRGIGELKLQKIVDTYNDLPHDADKIISVEGWAEKSVNQYMLRYTNFVEMVKFFTSLGIWNGFDDATLSNAYENVKVVFTGVRSAELENIIKINGGKVLTSCTKECNLVIARDPLASSTKLNKARQQGVEIISLDEAVKRFGKTEQQVSKIEDLDNPLAKLLI